jgi:hypothetical protein
MTSCENPLLLLIHDFSQNDQPHPQITFIFQVPLLPSASLTIMKIHSYLQNMIFLKTTHHPQSLLFSKSPCYLVLVTDNFGARFFRYIWPYSTISRSLYPPVHSTPQFMPFTIACVTLSLANN